MHLAYSALRATGKLPARPRTDARYRGYQAACKKHKDTIAAIQQYLPGWVPPLEEDLKAYPLRVTTNRTRKQR